MENNSEQFIPPLGSLTSDDERFMREALKEAYKAYTEEEVPIGAVIVFQGRIIARGHNQVEMLKDATAHAEILSITAAESALENWRLSGCTLYSTLEPCSMCAGALLLSRVERLVWAAPDIRQGANGSWVNLFDKPHPIHTLKITSGILAGWSERLMKQFFQKRREENKNGKELSSGI